MVDVFKTNVQNNLQAEKVLQILNSNFPDHKINFDLDDRDKILRVEGEDCITEDIRKMLNEFGLTCKTLD